MQLSVTRHGITHRGSFFHERYALRVTKRCLEEDLAGEIRLDADAIFESVRAHPIGKAFVSDRATDPDGGKTVGPAAGDRTLRRLGYGDDHRGVTWWDEQHGVVWLLAYHGKHRSGAVGDSFPHFEKLREDGLLYPTAEDYESLFEEDDLYFFDFVEEDAQETLAVAREHPGEEVLADIGRRVGTSIVVELVETLEETYVGFNWRQLQEIGNVTDTLFALLKGFYPDTSWDDWEPVSALPTRGLSDDEGCYRHFHG